MEESQRLFNEILKHHENSWSISDIAEEVGLSAYQIDLILSRYPTDEE